MADLIVKSKVRNQLEDYDIAMGFYDSLDERVAELLEEAADRAEANDRKTVMEQDV